MGKYDQGRRGAAGEISLAEKVAFLSRAEAHADGNRRIQAIETHLSWVFLGESVVYKLKKPLHEPYIDFRTVEQRRLNCAQEVRLNRRLAPGVYLGAVPLTRTPSDGLALGGEGHVVDWLVHMLRLPPGQMLGHAIERHHCSREQVTRAAERLARFYIKGAAEQLNAETHVRRIGHETTRRVRVLQRMPFDLVGHSLRGLQAQHERFIHQFRTLLESRARDGWIREGHGDLRPQHVCVGPEPLFIDCLEFSRTLRVLDPLDDLAYMVLECELMEATWVGDAFVHVYAELAGDDEALRLVPFYASRRALLRTFQALRHITNGAPVPRDHWLEKAEHYLRLAATLIRQALEPEV